jgi:hypothetical protein
MRNGINGASCSTEAISEEVKQKSCCNPFSTVDANVNDYLKVKNALVKDDSNGAAAAAKVLLATLMQQILLQLMRN